MGESFLMAAGLLVGQVHEIQVVQGQVMQPGPSNCNCQRHSTTYSQQRGWTQQSGWTTSPGAGWSEDKGFFGRVGDRFSELFGKRRGSQQQQQDTMPMDQGGQHHAGEWTAPIHQPVNGQVVPGTAQPARQPSRMIVSPSGEITIETPEPPTIKQTLKPTSYEQRPVPAAKPAQPSAVNAPVLIPLPELLPMPVLEMPVAPAAAKGAVEPSSGPELPGR